MLDEPFLGSSVVNGARCWQLFDSERSMRKLILSYALKMVN